MAIHISDTLNYVEEITATDAARGFRALLDRVERNGEAFRITRHGAVVAELRPRRSASGRDLKAMVRRHGADPGWRAEIDRVREESRRAARLDDPWGDER